MKNESMHLAVYGTLKRGFSNHDAYMREARFVAPALLEGAMYFARPESYPILHHPDTVRDPSHIRSHAVEIYEVPQAAFSVIREMEEEAGYCTRILTLAGYRAFVFLAPPFAPQEPAWLIEEFITEELPRTSVVY